MIGFVLLAAGWCGGVLWSGAQADVPIDHSDVDEPARSSSRPVTLILCASDSSWVSQTIDRTSGGDGFSHAYLDVGHFYPDGRRLIVDYRPGLGVHYAFDDVYAERPRARVELRGPIGEQVWGCVRARLGQPFNAAGAMTGTCTAATCSGVIWGCLPPELRRELVCSGRPIAPNDLARLFGARVDETVRYTRQPTGGAPEIGS